MSTTVDKISDDYQVVSDDEAVLAYLSGLQHVTPVAGKSASIAYIKQVVGDTFHVSKAAANRVLEISS